MKKIALVTGLVLATSTQAYNVVDRYTLINDKLETESMLRPIGHDFIFDFNVALNADAQTFVSDIKNASQTKTVQSAQTVLKKYENTEQTIKMNLNLGIPIFSFTAFDTKIEPNLRALIDVGANLGIRRDMLTSADATKFINVAIPASVQSSLFAAWDGTPTGQDLFQTANCNSFFASPAEANAFCLANQGKYFKPDPSVPNLNLFLKAQGKVGLFNQYTSGEHYFGDFNIYGLVRADAYQYVNYSMIAAGQKVEMAKKPNTEGTAQIDYHFGYRNSNYSVMAGIEELKLMTFKKRDVESKEQAYGYRSLMRVHGQAEYKISAFSLQPFAGVHKRQGYGFGDGVYAGAILGAHVWGDRLGLQLRGMVDPSYITLAPRIKLWLMQLEYSLKSPVKSTDGDVKLSAIHSLDFRLFF